MTWAWSHGIWGRACGGGGLRVSMFFLFPGAAHIHENKLEITIEDKCEYCEDYSREADNIKQHKQRKQTRKYLDV